MNIRGIKIVRLALMTLVAKLPFLEFQERFLEPSTLPQLSNSQQSYRVTFFPFHLSPFFNIRSCIKSSSPICRFAVYSQRSIWSMNTSKIIPQPWQQELYQFALLSCFRYDETRLSQQTNRRFLLTYCYTAVNAP